jgi:hypothetical protein
MEFQITRNTMFRKLDLLPSSGEGRLSLILFGLLERDNLDHWTVLRRGEENKHSVGPLSQDQSFVSPSRVHVTLSSLEDGNKSGLSNAVFQVFRFPDDGQSA